MQELGNLPAVKGPKYDREPSLGIRKYAPQGNGGNHARAGLESAHPAPAIPTRTGRSLCGAVDESRLEDRRRGLGEFRSPAFSAQPRQQRLSGAGLAAAVAGGRPEAALAGRDRLWQERDCGSRRQGVHGDGNRGEAVRDLPGSAYRSSALETAAGTQQQSPFRLGPGHFAGGR